jgi:hypothetical protein
VGATVISNASDMNFLGGRVASAALPSVVE